MAFKHVVTSALLITACAGCARLPIEPPKDAPSKVTMSGVGVVRRAPDVASLLLRIEVRAPRSAAAQQRAAEIASTLATRLRQLRIPDEAVQTASYQLSRDYDYVKGQSIFRGYLVRHTMQVRVEALARLGEIIDAVESVGPITIDGPEFGLRSSDAAEAEAFKQAVASARAKADSAAQASGARVVRILSIDEQGPGASMDERPLSPIAARAPQADAPQTHIAPGELTIAARVTMTAEIR